MFRTHCCSQPLVHLAHTLEPVNIDALDVSPSWKRKFHWLRRAGGPSMSNAKFMSREEQRKIPHFNACAFLLGPFYYVAKGMWRRAISLSIACLAAVLVLGLVLESLGYGKLVLALGYGAAAVFAVRANIDYYKKMVLRDNGWW